MKRNIVHLTKDNVVDAIKAMFDNGFVPRGGKVYGIPRGGTYIASMIQSLGFGTVVPFPEEADYIVDDCIDSGTTIEKWQAKFPAKPIVSLFACAGEWLVFPWEDSDPDEDAKDLVVRMLQHIGEDPKRTGLIDTPKRMVNMWKEIFRGYDDSQKPKIAVFPNGDDGVAYDEMVCDTGSYYSMCEHHQLPFFGDYHFAYIPNPKGLVLGLSKVARVVDHFAAKMQIQERLGSDILDELEKALTSLDGVKPLGLALTMEGEHLCKSMRGVKKKGKMRTTILRGVFKENPACKTEFLGYVNS